MPRWRRSPATADSVARTVAADALHRLRPRNCSASMRCKLGTGLASLTNPVR
ncbi:hypothetical protein [Mycolicibacterium aurum]|uniref:hypothetical protein n=1 Tax=Mycolicibacterium aurum TaxID=1791 RepID=UPI000AE54BC2|nr:hypothetical protein [Mycolicibacterium aurum]